MGREAIGTPHKPSLFIQALMCPLPLLRPHPLPQERVGVVLFKPPSVSRRRFVA